MSNTCISVIDVDDLINDLFEAPDFMSGAEMLNDSLEHVSLEKLNSLDQYEGITLLMKYCECLWFDGINILLNVNGIDINVEDERGLNAYMYVLNTYNNMMEQLMVNCDCGYTLDALNVVRDSIQNNIDLDANKIDKLLRHTSLHIKHGKYYPISDNEYVKIIKQIATRTFDGKFETVEKILTLFEEKGFGVDVTNAKKYLKLCLEPTINYHDGNTHCMFRNYDSLIYVLNKLDELNISTTFFLEEVEKTNFENKSEKKLIKEFIIDKSTRKNYYLKMLENL